MAKVKNDYFKMMEDQAGKCVEASDLLTEIFREYNYADIPSKKDAMHAIENQADKARYDIIGKLYGEFITPIDQEDILRLVQLIDDITDAIDEVVMQCYMYYITELPEFSYEFASIINECVNHLWDAIKEFRGFKKPEKIRENIARVNDAETKADVLYAKAIHEMFRVKSKIPPAEVLFVSKIMYDSLENCCDLCEIAADVIEQIIIKNT